MSNAEPTLDLVAESAPADGVPPWSPVGVADRPVLLGLLGLQGVGRVTVERLRHALGGLSQVAAAPGRVLSAIDGLTETARAALAETSGAVLAAQGQRDLERLAKLGARAVVLGDADYPVRAAQAAFQPLVLSILGTIPDALSVAVVGMRRPDKKGAPLADRLARHLAASGACIVSGAAEGIDTIAHTAALDSGTPTVAVIGKGLGPGLVEASKQELLARIARQGAVVSEFAFHDPGGTGHFPQRNKTIAALADALVLVRGNEKSGSLHSARATYALKRELFAVPGDPTDANSAAPNSVLLGGGRATIDGTEILRKFGRLAVTAPAEARPPSLPPSISDEARRLFALLSAVPRHVDELSNAAQLSPAQASAALLDLELAGVARARPGNLYSWS